MVLKWWLSKVEISFDSKTYIDTHKSSQGFRYKTFKKFSKKKKKRKLLNICVLVALFLLLPKYVMQLEDTHSLLLSFGPPLPFQLSNVLLSSFQNLGNKMETKPFLALVKGSIYSHPKCIHITYISVHNHLISLFFLANPQFKGFTIY